MRSEEHVTALLEKHKRWIVNEVNRFIAKNPQLKNNGYNWDDCFQVAMIFVLERVSEDDGATLVTNRWKDLRRTLREWASCSAPVVNVPIKVYYKNTGAFTSIEFKEENVRDTEPDFSADVDFRVSTDVYMASMPENEAAALLGKLSGVSSTEIAQLLDAKSRSQVSRWTRAKYRGLYNFLGYEIPVKKGGPYGRFGLRRKTPGSVQGKGR